MPMERLIIHVDMDAFYASVEQRDRPHLRNKPVIVGGAPHSRGVVATCSYEARKYGVHSAMSSRRAFALCPQATFVKPRFQAYRQVSQHVMEIFKSVTPFVEPLSLDEAYLDVTENSLMSTSAPYVARYILGEIKRRTGLTASAGVAPSKFVAKIASGFDKPNGLTIVAADEVESFLAPLSITTMHGVGKVTAQILFKHDFETIADIQEARPEQLKTILGHDRGVQLYELAHGRDSRPVVPSRERKSIGSETTFAFDLDDPEEVYERVIPEIEDVLQQLDRRELSCQTVTIKIKTSEFQARSHQIKLNHPTHDHDEIKRLARRLFDEMAINEPVRLIGMTVSDLIPRTETARQLTFDELTKPSLEE
ncbi:impB/mucB/samB family protein [Exiguobacterium sp. S17]|nr:impB/mucB/samB family protein [Exiguobacterium sp. S17]